MAYPTNDDPDLNKLYKMRRERPARGRRDAHKGQGARKSDPQYQAQEDRRQLQEGEKKGSERRGP